MCQGDCLVPVWRFPSPSRSIHFVDVSEANGRETASHLRLDHVTRNAFAARNNEASGLGNFLSSLSSRNARWEECCVTTLRTAL